MGERPKLLDEEEADSPADGRQHDEDHDDDPPVAEAAGVVAPGVKRAPRSMLYPWTTKLRIG